MKKSLLFALALFIISCKGSSNKPTTANLNEYRLTLNFYEKDSTYSIQSENDTTAYMEALDLFYKEMIKQKELTFFGEPTGFSIVDKKNMDLTIKLDENLVSRLQDRAKSVPDVKKMLDENAMDSLVIQ
ncbi:hypothetical protein [Pedobacter glucosidilyticus]|uniref:hypothetical protein n=1 Tax=Pedobacter glucosidilyticus TaxID=1122941 RepID=UPI00047D0C44|nr:hypothetical protein [Pedobacter glucosidilyticus]